MPLDYSKTYIYKLCCKDVSITDVYVGSTINFAQRKRMHRSCCTNEAGKQYDRNPYSFIREHGGWSNWDMVLVDTVNVADKLEAHKAERGYIESLSATLNKQTPASTRSETGRKYYESHKDNARAYRAANKEKIKDNARAYRAANKEKNQEYQKQYRLNHQEENRKYLEEYRKANKGKLREQRAEYIKANKEKLREQNTEYVRRRRAKKRAEQAITNDNA